MMLLPPTLFTLFLVISVGRCQFVYNYEEADANGSSREDTEDPALYNYNSPSATNEQFQSKRVRSPTVQSEAQNAGARRSSVREKSFAPEIHTQTSPSEYIEESETPRNDPAQPRKRKYRRILREGTYFEPPQPPKIYSPSVFENIGLGQAPSGVYVPQDSFLNILKNRQGITSQYIPQSMPTYSRNYHNPPVTEGPTFYVQPPSNEEGTWQHNTNLPAVQPSVRYTDGSASSMSSDPPPINENVEMSNHRRTQATRRQRQRNQSNSLLEPMADTDALRTNTDAIREDTTYVPQARQVSQPRAARNRQRQTVPLQNYLNPIQPPKTYSPSIFLNVGLGEAPNGVHIPEDSLLNVLKSPSKSQLPTRNTVENSQLSSRSDTEEQNYFQPATSDQPEYLPPDSRRRSRQRSHSAVDSGRNVRRRTQHQSNRDEPEPVQAAPASSQQQRRQRTQTNRRRDTNLPDRKSSADRQQTRAESRPSQPTSTRQQHYKPAKLAIAALPDDTDDDGIPGEAGVNYPTLHTIPRTTFSCAEQQHNGYYADLETSCQVVHLCQARGVKSSFLCPNGTIFSQEKFACQWWYKVNCEESPKFYSINDSLYKIPEKSKLSKE